MVYASTFVSGLQDVVRAMLETLFPHVKIILLLDGLVVYKGNMSIQQVRNARFFNNSFVVLRQFRKLRHRPMHTMLTEVARDSELGKTVSAGLERADAGRTFRVIASRENQFVTVDHRLLVTVERSLSGIKGLKVNRAKPQLEFWFLYRREGYGFFLKRLTRNTAHQKTLEKGALRPELTHILNFISEPDADDIFLDPFCGYGSIPIERATSFPYNMIFAADKNRELVKLVRQKIKGSRIKGTFIVKEQDALDMQAFEDGFIHKIVTDPPWGLFADLGMDARQFYARTLQECYRVLRVGGLLVILVARRNELDRAIEAYKGRAQLLDKYDILVSGKKATIYKLQKTA